MMLLCTSDEMASAMEMELSEKAFFIYNAVLKPQPDHDGNRTLISKSHEHERSFIIIVFLKSS